MRTFKHKLIKIRSERISQKFNCRLFLQFGLVDFWNKLNFFSFISSINKLQQTAINRNSKFLLLVSLPLLSWFACLLLIWFLLACLDWIQLNWMSSISVSFKKAATTNQQIEQAVWIKFADWNISVSLQFGHSFPVCLSLLSWNWSPLHNPWLQWKQTKPECPN